MLFVIKRRFFTSFPGLKNSEYDSYDAWISGGVCQMMVLSFDKRSFPFSLRPIVRNLDNGENKKQIDVTLNMDTVGDIT